MPAPPVVTDELLRDFSEALRPQLAGDLHIDAMTRALYATDASLYQMQPIGVLIPKRVDDVQAALETAAHFNLPVLPRGGGSSLAGQAVGTALVIDFTRHLDAIHEINAEDGWVRAQPGITLDRLNAALQPHGLMVGPDPASGNRATLGGMVANNATGTHSILYGNMIRHVRSVETLLSDGTRATFDAVDAGAWAERQRREGLEGYIHRALDRVLAEHGEVVARDTPRHWRRNSGYRLEYLLDEERRNIAHLLCGSEGTLAVTTDVTLDLVPRPQETALGIVHFHTRDEALRAVTTILETEPSAVELFDGVAIEQARNAPGFAHRLTFIDGDPGAVLITEYVGTSSRELKSKIERLEEQVGKTAGYAVVRALTPEHIDNVWTVRKEGLGLVMGVKGDYKPVALIEDASVPVEHLADYVEDLDALLQETNTRAVFYAHASAGCLHVRPFINTKDAAEVEKMREIALGSMELVATYGGSVSSEHGDGIVRGWLNGQFLGAELCDVYRRVKQIFDPDHLLNPGKIIDTPLLTDHLRMGPNYKTTSFRAELDWSEDGGFARSVELCNGNGACRKLDSGTMCPSFMVTRDEQDSTRGRANALRAALSGALPREELTGERMTEVMDLCIQCKGCKTECPSNVDMAKMKTEWLNAYWKSHRMPLRTRLFAYQPHLARTLAGTPLAGLANWCNQRTPVRKLLDWTLGISQERMLPPFALRPFTAWFKKRRWTSEGPPVVLFADTFNNCHQPTSLRAAATFLHRVGYQVVVPEATVCCGRPFISKGMITEAQSLALRTVERLHPYVEQGMPIVGLEPSCILTLSDEFLSLLPGDLHAKTVAAAVTTFEEFVAQEAEDGAFANGVWTDAARSVLLHGHCHQKALVGTTAAERCLSLPPNYTVTAVDSGCCGMAGSFGYEREHVHLSRAMAERRLAPAVRETNPDTLIAAAGFSCRSQIKDTTERQASHPAEILLDALV